MEMALYVKDLNVRCSAQMTPLQNAKSKASNQIEILMPCSLGKETFRFIQSHSTRYKFDKGAGKVMTIVRVGREQDGGESAKNI